MKNYKLFNSIGKIKDEYIEEARKKNAPIIQKKWIRLALIAACCVVFVSIGVSIYKKNTTKIDLHLSSNSVNAKYIERAPKSSLESDLEKLTEREIFTKYNTIIYKGTITEIQNIEIDINGSKIHRAISKIKVENVFRGNCKKNDTLKVLLPCPIDKDNILVEDTNIISAMREGMTGIFMTIEYDENTLYSENNSNLFLKDIADYGFMDGVRYLFLETSNGLVFSKEFYKSLNTITTFNEVENYIENMIN